MDRRGDQLMILGQSILFGLLGWLFGFTPTLPLAEYQTTGPIYQSQCVKFELETDQSRTYEFAEYPTDPAGFAHGMKHRHHVDRKEFMIFNMQGMVQPRFWMQDTPTSLDIAFFDIDGTLTYLAPNTTPNSEQNIGPKSSSPIQYVLEMKAGLATDFGLEVGATRLLVAPPTSCPEPSKRMTQ
jgi:uncharacterized membrane protein (UPF0127 family)